MSAISVIIPVYKVEKYLDRCVRSVLDQSFSDLEIILVDDGSPDSCPAMCDALAAGDSRIRVIHKANGGLSSARNAGLDVATGEYIGFIDSDDYIAPEMYEKLLSAIKEQDADVAICNYAFVSEDTGETDSAELSRSPLRDGVLTREEGYRCIDAAVPGYTYYVTAWNKLYRREIFDGLRFMDGKIHEDEYIVHHVFKKCSRIATLGEPLYMYVQRSGSITKGTPSVKTLHAVHAMMDRYEFYRDEGCDELARDMLHACFWRIKDTLPLLKPLKKEHCAEIKSAYDLVQRELIARRDIHALRMFAAWLRF